jgi:hypothetical protein
VKLSSIHYIILTFCQVDSARNPMTVGRDEGAWGWTKSFGRSVIINNQFLHLEATVSNRNGLVALRT